LAADRSRSVGSFCLLIALVVTFFLIGGQQAKEPLAADLAAPSLTAWQRPDVGRLTIEWPEAIRVRQKKEKGQLVLRFASPLPLSANKTITKVSEFVDPNRTSINDKDLVLALRNGVTADVTIRQKRIVIIDFARDPSIERAATVEVSTIENGVRLSFLWPGPTDVVSSPGRGQLRVQVIPNRKINATDLAQLQTTLKPWLNQVRLDQSLPGIAMIFDLKPDITPSVRPNGPNATIVDLKRVPISPPVSTSGQPTHIFIPGKKPNLGTSEVGLARHIGPPLPKKRPSQQVATSKANPSSGPVDPEVAPTDSSPEALVFNWIKPVSAAAFTRAGYLWVVFDEPDASLLTALPSPPPSFDDGAFVQADGGTAVRYRIRKPVDIRIARPQAGQWRIDPTSHFPPAQTINVERVDEEGTLRLAPVLNDRIVSMIDPTVGDRIQALPISDVGLGHPAKRRFVDLELLPTTQGLAWRPLNDRLRTQVEDEALVFNTPDGLSISVAGNRTSELLKTVVKSVAPKQKADDKEASPKVARPAGKPADVKSQRPVVEPKISSFLNFANSGVDRSLAADTRRILRQAVHKASPAQRDMARLNLARFLVAERLGNEARTVLGVIAEDAEPDILRQRDALLGAATYVADNLNEATNFLKAPHLENDDEIDIWRAALQSRSENWEAAAEHWRAAGKTLDRYPPRLKFDLGLLAIEAAIEIEDDKLIRQGFRRLKPLSLSPLEEAGVQRMRVLQSERSGDLDDARSILRDLLESPYHRIRALAAFQLADIDLKNDVDLKDVLSDLNDRLALWRGHPDEREILDQIAGRLEDKDAFRQALRLWRRLIDRYPGADEDADLTKARQETFIRALTGATETEFDTADPYAIYLDYVDLLPEEPEARAIHQHLAQHLTDLDLADEAINVLRTLLTSSQNDVERVELVIKTSLLMVQERRFEEALSVLGEIDDVSSPLPASLIEQARLTKARTLSYLDRLDDALSELEDFQSQPAWRLRAEIFWKAKRWQRLAASVESYFADDGPAASLTPEEQRLALWLALARSREGTSAQLRALRDRFGDAMRDGPHFKTFNVVTQSLPEARDVPGLLSATDQQLSELRQYREAKPTDPR